MKLLVIFVTCPEADQAANLATILVQENLVACGNILPGVRSIYRWEGKIKDEAEVLLLLKTEEGKYPALEKRIKALHPYQLPEIVAFAADRGLPAYFEWVESATQKP